jgi:hypothetical protein
MSAVIDHAAEKSRSYRVRESLPGATPGRDWSHRQPGTSPVFMIARRDDHNFVAGQHVELLSTSNAGFSGITGHGRDRTGSFVHMGSLGAWDIARDAAGSVK